MTRILDTKSSEVYSCAACGRSMLWPSGWSSTTINEYCCCLLNKPVGGCGTVRVEKN